MTDAALERVRAGTKAGRPGLLARLKRACVGWLVVDTPEADPTAGFSAREWADLPTHHPRDDR